VRCIHLTALFIEPLFWLYRRIAPFDEDYVGDDGVIPLPRSTSPSHLCGCILPTLLASVAIDQVYCLLSADDVCCPITACLSSPAASPVSSSVSADCNRTLILIETSASTQTSYAGTARLACCCNRRKSMRNEKMTAHRSVCSTSRPVLSDARSTSSVSEGP
jgi:hypothetical protein